MSRLCHTCKHNTGEKCKLKLDVLYGTESAAICFDYKKKEGNVKKVSSKKEAKTNKAKVVKGSGSLETVIIPESDVFCSQCKRLIGKNKEGKHWYIEGIREPLCTKCYPMVFKKKEKEDLDPIIKPEVPNERFLVIISSNHCMGMSQKIEHYLFKTQEAALKCVNHWPSEFMTQTIYKITSLTPVSFEAIYLERKVQAGKIVPVKECNSYE